ncbi:MAG: prolyl oligopeptidase family serine peptidase [Bryobacteraceae bacterium]
MRRLVLSVLLCGLAYGEAPPNLAERIASHTRRPELAPGQEAGVEVSFPGAAGILKGFLFKPKGHGPFPALLWNHGSEKNPGTQPELAAFYNAKGFVFFIPHRSGQGRSPGKYIVDTTDEYKKEHPGDVDGFRKEAVRLHDVANADVQAAVSWLSARPFIDKNRIVMSGCSYGGIQTVLSAEEAMGVLAFVPFAPAAMSWANVELRKRLITAIHSARAPIFLLQAQNDYSIGPSEVLGPAIRAKGGPNAAKLYPVFGTTPQQGHAAFACWNIGTEVWGSDVTEFINTALAASQK